MDTISFLNMASIAFQKAADAYKADGKELSHLILRRSVMISMQHLRLLEHIKTFNNRRATIWNLSKHSRKNLIREPSIR